MGCVSTKERREFKRENQHAINFQNEMVKNGGYAPRLPSPSAPSLSVMPTAAPVPVGRRNMACPEMRDVPRIDNAFFRNVRYHEDRDFVVVVDKSGSMNATDRCSKTHQTRRRWDNARNAIEAIVSKAVEHDDDGITLYLFSSDYNKFDNVDCAQRVIDIFDSNKPRGSTDLAGVLSAVFQEHFSKGDKPTTALVITDGQPNSESQVIDVIERAANRVHSQEELSVTFIQIGDDDGAQRFLKRLDDELNCKYDIVDTLKDDCLQNGLSFEELIHLSVTD
eukprot:TRINITY_DN8708_c0_g2_i4.p1 TRINITY_DN8708_c0_g2~~TRINITY_DN8708_c0_g2_i4.p1  ORF type:complete len:279 (+),score=49.91 TRINITY_DN8708_c0_g2_i4:67-903(+)